jgi:hypothetical protein
MDLHFPRGGNKSFLKVDLHYDDYCSKLVHFEAQKIFSLLKKP